MALRLRIQALDTSKEPGQTPKPSKTTTHNATPPLRPISPSITRRDWLTAAVTTSTTLLLTDASITTPPAHADLDSPDFGHPIIPDYATDGPCMAIKLPLLEHTCTTCSTSADRCRLRIQAFYPKGGARAGLEPPYPLAIITSGFLIGSDQYASYAQRLATWGYVVLTYDANQQALDPITDTTSVALLRDLIDWCRIAQPLASVTNTEEVLLIGHSRGGKISTLASSVEPRVKSLLLLDPVDVTVYAPLAPDFPSATETLKTLQFRETITPRDRPLLPVSIIGTGLGKDCVPPDSNYSLYYDAAPGAAFEAVLTNAGHLQFLDARTTNLLDAVCIAGDVSDGAVAEVTKALMVAWAEATIRGDASKNSKKRFGVVDGAIVAGPWPALDTLTQLYGAERAARERLKSRGEDVDISTRAKNFAML